MLMLYTRHNFEVADFCDARGIRPELAGILVTPNGTAATDSYVLLEVSSPSADNAEKDFPAIPGHAVKARDDQFIFPKEAASQVLKTIPKNTNGGSGILRRAAVLETDKGFAGFIAADPVHIRPTNRQGNRGKVSRVPADLPDGGTELGHLGQRQVPGEAREVLCGVIQD